MLLVLKPEVVSSRRLTGEDQQQLLQDIVDEVCYRNSPNMQREANDGKLTTLCSLEPVPRSECPRHARQEPRRRSLRGQDRRLCSPAGPKGLRDSGSDEKGS